jgi:hypothetical protein
VPGCWAALRPHGARRPRRGAASDASAAELDARAAAAGRNAVLAVAFSLYVTAQAASGLAGADAERLRREPYASTPHSTHLMQVAAAYFVHDVACVLIDQNEGMLEWLVHGVLCAWVFLCSLRPFIHRMGYVTLLFEASTPFYHLRAALLAAGRGQSTAFFCVQVCFASSFFATRILFGLYSMFAPGQWWWRMQALLGEKVLHSAAVVRGYQACCVLLSLLNCFWMVRIVSGALKKRSPKNE